MKTDQLLNNLMQNASPSGSEGSCARVLKDHFKKSPVKISGDMIGNVEMSLQTGKSLGTVMLTAHIDEIGFMVRYIDDNGFIHFSTVGGWDPCVIPGCRVTFQGKKGLVQGVIGRTAIHLLDAKDRDRPVKLEDLFIDIGCAKKKEAEALLQLGDVGVVDSGTLALNGDRVACRGADDKIGVYIISRVLENLSRKVDSLKFNVCGLATTQEEIGGRGAAAGAYRIKPDLCIALDVTHAVDFPEIDRKKHHDISLGKGPVITLGPILHPWITDRLRKTAQKLKIKTQIETTQRFTGTDADDIQKNRGGIPTGLIGIPLRYMHTPSEVYSENDIADIIKLLERFVLDLDRMPDFRIA
ncbi:MAG: M20/M25/M40 family metallo-hydrolase [Candidatus Wallbacteria bacterium]|nr:M20/M25/M40 family metallo-hydrolase [Candidatus Wallbacteria bacterium]